MISIRMPVNGECLALTKIHETYVSIILVVHELIYHVKLTKNDCKIRTPTHEVILSAIKMVLSKKMFNHGISDFALEYLSRDNG